MARARAKGVFVVVPAQFDAGTAVKGISFPTAAKAQEFCTKVAKFANKLAAKMKGLEGDEAKKYADTLCQDILMQGLTEDGKPNGGPQLFDTIGYDPTEGEDEDEDED